MSRGEATVRGWLIGSLCLVLAVTGCAADKRDGKPPLPIGAPQNLAEATPEQFVQLMPVVDRYFYHRKQAVVTGNLDGLWQAFPDLKQGTDKQAAINAEADVVARYRDIAPIDGDVEPEGYTRLLVRVDEDHAVVLVNGTETYLLKDFVRSGGQVQLLLYLERRSGQWTVVKTDETTLAEYHQALK